MVTVAQLASNQKHLIFNNLLVNSKSKILHPLVGSLMTCFKKLACFHGSLVNVLACLLTRHGFEPCSGAKDFSLTENGYCPH